jgi:DNA repair protein RecO (recombination protein O)
VALDGWLRGDAPAAELDDLEARAHQRLLREFLREHLTDGRPLRAFEAWEGEQWAPAAAADAGHRLA